MGTSAEQSFELQEEAPIPKKPTNLSIREFSPEVVINGDFYCRGDITSPDEGYKGLLRKNIALWLKPPGEVERVISRKYSDASGVVEFTRALSSFYYKPGLYRFWLGFAGDDEYEGCGEESEEVSILAGLSWG